jgi:hypothetical protein
VAAPETEKKVTSLDVQLFSRQMYTLLKSGVPIMRGLAGLQESAVSKSFGARHPRPARVARRRPRTVGRDAPPPRMFTPSTCRWCGWAR